MTAAVEGKLGEPSSSNETITGTPGAAPSVTTGALLASFNKLKDYSANLYSQRRPWGEVFDRTAFSRPTNFSEATSRVRRNATYFKINYAAFMVIALLVVMLMNPSSLAVLALLGTGWLYVFVFRTRPITIGDRTLRSGFTKTPMPNGMGILWEALNQCHLCRFGVSAVSMKSLWQ